MRVIITGGTGLVGKALIEKLKTQYSSISICIFTRSQKEAQDNVQYVQYEPANHKVIDQFAPKHEDVIIHLAGAGIADKSWSPSRKKILESSRVDPIKTLFKYFDVANVKPGVVISMSGINCYETNTTEKQVEADAYAEDYLSQLVKTWESAVHDFNRITRVVILRLGMVLSSEGGALDRLKPIVKKNLASPLGSGKQPMPYVHIDDVVAAICFVIDNKQLDDTYNCIATEIVDNTSFMKALGQQLNKKVWSLNVPKFVMKLAFGKMSSMLLEGVNASNDKLKSEGFTFKYDGLDEALKDVLKEK